MAGDAEREGSENATGRGGGGGERKGTFHQLTRVSLAFRTRSIFFFNLPSSSAARRV